MLISQTRKGKAMKRALFAVLLTASAAFVLVGCSDDSTVPVSPADQTPQVSTALEKANLTNFTFTHNPIPPYFVDPGVVKEVDGMWIMKDVGVIEQVLSDDPLIAGTMIHYLSATMNATTGEGPVHGKATLTPTADVGGGVWEVTYEGYRSKSGGIYFTLPLKLVAHGRGGTIEGIQAIYESTITAWGTPPQGWFGAGRGFYKSH